LIRAIKSELQQELSRSPTSERNFLVLKSRSCLTSFSCTNTLTFKESLQPTICYLADPARLQCIPGVFWISQGPIRRQSSYFGMISTPHITQRLVNYSTSRQKGGSSARQVACPTMIHLTAVRRVLRYLQGTYD
jgi:hypothetical protein